MSKSKKRFEINSGELFSEENIRQDETIVADFEELKSHIEIILIREKKISVAYEPNKERADYIESKWLMLNEYYNRADENPFPSLNYFLVENQNPELNYEALKNLGLDPFKNYDLYSYNQKLIIKPKNQLSVNSGYLLMVAFKIRQLRDSDLIDFLEYQRDYYWHDSILKKIRFLSGDYPNLISDSKKGIIEEWVKDVFKNSNTTGRKILMPDAVIIFYFLLEAHGLWWGSGEVTQNDLAYIISQIHGSSQDNIEREIRKFLRGDKALERMKIAKKFLEPLKSEKINSLIDKEIRPGKI